MPPPASRMILKMGALVLTVFIGVPVVLMVIVASSILLSPLNFLMPIVSLIVFGLFIWAVVEIVRRVGRPPGSPLSSLIKSPPVQLNEADLRIVLESKDITGEIRQIAETLGGGLPSSQLLGLAAVADGLLNSLPTRPEAFDAIRPSLTSYLPRVLAAARRLLAHRTMNVDELGMAAAMLASAMREIAAGRQADQAEIQQAVGILQGIRDDSGNAIVVQAPA